MKFIELEDGHRITREVDVKDKFLIAIGYIAGVDGIEPETKAALLVLLSEKLNLQIDALYKFVVADWINEILEHKVFV